MKEYKVDPIIDKIKKITTEKVYQKGGLIIKPANEWLEESKKLPNPKMLFSEFWFEGEVCILFSATNLGKTALAYQIADSITKGKPITNFKMEAERQKVLYFDFELSEKQFEGRYSNHKGNLYLFDDNFIRIEFHPDESNLDNFEKKLFESIETAINVQQSKVLIIDNITYLKEETQRANHAVSLMRKLKILKNKYNLSLLVLAHTIKNIEGKPIIRDQVLGSSNISNLCDSMFAIGASKLDKNMRYIKQIKARACEIIYDTNNVIATSIGNLDNYLEFEFVKYDQEKNHIITKMDIQDIDLEYKIIELWSGNPNQSYETIARKVGTYKMKVYRTLVKYGIK